MTKVIVFESEDGSLHVLRPVENCGLTVEEIAHKDVPAGKRYKIVEDTDLPDPYFFTAWEHDFADHDDVAMGSDAFWEGPGKELLPKLTPFDMPVAPPPPKAGPSE